MTRRPPPAEIGASRLTRAVWIAVAASLALALLANVGFIATTIGVRLPYWGEAEVIFEASRLRQHLPLFVDPLAGALEDGAPPSRYYVTYPPVWSWVVSLVPGARALVFARAACSVAWLGSLAAVAWTARRESRANASLAAAFVGGTWVLTNFASVGRPDSIACAVAALALARVATKGRVDLASAALLVLVPWIKPTCIGLPAGALLGAALVERARAARSIALAVLLALALALVAQLGSGGALFAHVVRSNAQPLSLGTWLDQVPARLPFFAPLLAWAAWTGWRCPSPGARIALTALVGSSLFTIFALAKTGSSSNYWMEPCVAAVVVLSRSSPGPIRFGQGRLAHAAAALGAVLWPGVASVRGAIEHARTTRAEAGFVAAARARCGASAEDVIAADEAGIELTLNGRILTPTYQMVHLVRAGAYPPEPWLADLASPRTRCFVEHTGYLRLAPVLARALEADYELVADEAGFRLWKRRAPRSARP